MLKPLLTSIAWLTCFAFASESQNAMAQPNAAAKGDPCANAMTEKEMNQCSAEEYRKAEAHLNRVYGKLLKPIPDEAEKQEVKTIEKAWSNIETFTALPRRTSAKAAA